MPKSKMNLPKGFRFVRKGELLKRGDITHYDQKVCDIVIGKRCGISEYFRRKLTDAKSKVKLPFILNWNDANKFGLPKGWRFVRVGAVIKEFDKCWIDRQGWTTTELADAKVGIKHTYIRRGKGK